MSNKNHSVGIHRPSAVFLSVFLLLPGTSLLAATSSATLDKVEKESSLASDKDILAGRGKPRRCRHISNDCKKEKAC